MTQPTFIVLMMSCYNESGPVAVRDSLAACEEIVLEKIRDYMKANGRYDEGLAATNLCEFKICDMDVFSCCDGLTLHGAFSFDFLWPKDSDAAAYAIYEVVAPVVAVVAPAS